MLLDKIVKTTNKKEITLNKLRESKLPLVIYGAGSYALDVLKFLHKNGIRVDAAFVDAEYLPSDQCYLNEKNEVKITTIEDIRKWYDTFNVLIGFSDFKKAEVKLMNIQGIAEIFFIDAPDKLEFFDYQYIVDNLKDFDFTYNLLGDQLSKDTFIAYINAKISGQPDSLYNLMDENQYFTDLVPLGLNETFVDCGAYDGDTIIEFNKKTKGQYKKIYAFEPDERNCSRLKQNIIERNIRHVQIIQKGCWHSEATLRYSPDANMTSLISNDGDFSIGVEAIDNVVDQDEVTFLKMDIEGSVFSIAWCRKNN